MGTLDAVVLGDDRQVTAPAAVCVAVATRMLCRGHTWMISVDVSSSYLCWSGAWGQDPCASARALK